MSVTVFAYTPELAERWNATVAASKNGTFLLDRRYMDYHADRFADSSLVAAVDDRWVALVPANRRGDVVYSHQGLTYGGLVVGADMTTPAMLAVFDAIADHLRADGVRELVYKTVPHIYHRYPAEEDRYALFRLGAELVRRDVLAVIEPQRRLPMQERRRRGLRKAEKAGMSVREAAGDAEWAAFWAILEDTLREQHGTNPVHSLEEISLLRARFPDNIRLFVAGPDTSVLAGCVVYETETVAHIQYIASSPEGRTNHCLDLLFPSLLDTVFAAKKWFDFGISNEGDGRILNVGLIEQKEGFGARAVVHDHYRLAL